jgi:hypothetical protein
LTEDHILLEQDHGRWRISGLIDFGDALIAPREYEWIALWFGALECHADEFMAFMRGYKPPASVEPPIPVGLPIPAEPPAPAGSTDPATTGTVFDKPFFNTTLAFTFLHEFSAGIIDVTLKRLGYPPVRSLRELQRVLWKPEQFQ